MSQATQRRSAEPDKIHYPKPPHPWYVFKLKDQELFALAGLYNVWTEPKTKEELFTYTIITTDPMDYWRVPDEVKNPKNDYPEVIEHYQSSKQAPLLN